MFFTRYISRSNNYAQDQTIQLELNDNDVQNIWRASLNCIVKYIILCFYMTENGQEMTGRSGSGRK